ncbi:OmpH family outer membrane protein [Dysgonomonas sp. 216]|uniref:OmpH family outer membrane protein n=1 Tax=Dysgonomonas sp. 216 TaxID=2302934 RepID=UPI0013D183BA|nr:OmpH family outer membrane protein [Dysgonomonas sp. 216]NDW19030.1 OmpH family outer membrane protein [Dysgonomonas sp. 216]
MVKKIVLSAFFCLCLVLPYSVSSQTIVEIKVAYINSVELLESVPGKPEATKAINELNNKYKAELEVMEKDYNKKYSDFISYQNTMAESIKLRRMQELYELEKSIADFMRIAQEDIESQEQYLIEPLKGKLAKAIEEVGLENNFTCIYDKASSSVAFITPRAIDANALVTAKLKN